jgi:hypothetical protein
MMSPILFLIIRISIPVGIGLALNEALKPKLGKWAPGAAAQCAYLGFMLSLVLLQLIRGHFAMGTLDILLLLGAIGGLVFLVVQPGLPAAGLIIGVHAVVLIRHLIHLPQVFKYFFLWLAIFTVAEFAFSIVPIVFLAKPLKDEL